MSGAEVYKHAITRRVLSERCGHVKGIGKKVKGIRSSTSTTTASHADFAPRSSSVDLIHMELAVTRAKSQQYQQRLDVM